MQIYLQKELDRHCSEYINKLAVYCKIWLTCNLQDKHIYSKALLNVSQFKTDTLHLQDTKKLTINQGSLVEMGLEHVTILPVTHH